MGRITLGQRVAEAYGHFKASWWFTGTLCIGLSVWWSFHHFYGFDTDKSWIELVLSIEAAVGGGLLYQDMARNEKARKSAEDHRRRQDEHARQQSESMLTLLKAIREAVEEKS